MPIVRIKWNRVPNPFEQMRRLPQMETILNASADAIAAGCGEGYEAKRGDGATRSRAAVLPVTAEAMVDNATHNTLLTNLDRGRT